MKSLALFIPLFCTLAFTSTQVAVAAPCCGALSATPTMITGDDAAQITVSLAQSNVIGDAPASGLPVFRADGDTELARTLRVEGAVLLTDRWQIGAGIPFTQRSRDATQRTTSGTRLGDMTANAAFEILPEWEYSAWKPRGFVFTQLLVPSGESIYDTANSTQDSGALNTRGRGFYTLGTGGLLIKSFSDWDTLLYGEIHRGFSRTFGSNADTQMRVTPGWGGSVALGAGYNLTSIPLRLGLSLAPAYEAGIQVEGTNNSTSKPQLVWNASAQVGWSITRSASVNAIYTDQTLVGPVSNISLNRTLSISFQKRWER